MFTKYAGRSRRNALGYQPVRSCEPVAVQPTVGLIQRCCLSELILEQSHAN